LPGHFPTFLCLQLVFQTVWCRDIDKVGSIDAYIMGTPDSKLQSDVAVELRQKMIRRLLAESRRQQPQPQPQGKQKQQKQQQQFLPPAAAAAAAPAQGGAP
jgi:hypothetical protein